MTWKNPVAVFLNDVFYSISHTKGAEKFLLRYWRVFPAEQLNRTVMACLLSWDGNEELNEAARRRFIEAARTAGILVCAGAPASAARRVIRRSLCRPARLHPAQAGSGPSSPGETVAS